MVYRSYAIPYATASSYHNGGQRMIVTIMMVVMILTIGSRSPYTSSTSSLDGTTSFIDGTATSSYGSGGIMVAMALSADAPIGKGHPPVAAAGSIRNAVIDLGKYSPSVSGARQRDKNLKPLSSVGETRDSASVSILLRCNNDCRSSATLYPLLTRQAHFVNAQWANLAKDPNNPSKPGLPSLIANGIDIGFLVNGSTSARVIVQQVSDTVYLIVEQVAAQSFPLVRVVGVPTSFNYSINPILISAQTTRANNVPVTQVQPSDPSGIQRTYQCLGMVQDDYWNDNTEGGASQLYPGILKVSRATEDSCLHPYYADVTPRPYSTSPNLAPGATPPPTVQVGTDFVASTTSGSDTAVAAAAAPATDNNDNQPNNTAPPAAAEPLLYNTGTASGLSTPPTPSVYDGISILATISPNTGIETLNVDWAMSSFTPPPSTNVVVGATISLKSSVEQVSTVVGQPPLPFIASCYGGFGPLVMSAITQAGQPQPVITLSGMATRSHQAFKIQLPAPTQTGSGTITLICTDASPPSSEVGERNYNIHRHDHYDPPQHHHDHHDGHHHHGHEHHEHYDNYGHIHHHDGGYREGEIREHDKETRRRAADYSTNDIIPYHVNQASQSFTYSVAPAVAITSPIPNVSTVQGSVPCPLTITCSGGYYPYTLTGIATRISGETSSFIPGLFAPVTNGPATGPIFTITLPAPGPGATRIELQCTDSQGFSQKSNAFTYTVYAPVMINQLSSITTVRGNVPKPFHVICDGGRRGGYSLSGSASSRDSTRGPITTEAVIASIRAVEGKVHQFLVSLPAAPNRGHSEITLTCSDHGGASASTFFDFTVHDWVSIGNVATVEAVYGSAPDDFIVECFGGFHPYILQASSIPFGVVSLADIHPASPHSFTVSLPPPTSTQPSVITLTCADHLGFMANTSFNYFVAPQVSLQFPSSMNMLAEAVVGYPPASFDIQCSGGFAPYKLTAHSASDRPISGHEVQRALRRLTINPLTQPSVWILTLPIPRLSGSTTITMRCEDEAGHIDSKSFTYSVAGALTLTTSVNDALIAVAYTAPKHFHLECKGGYWPYRITGSATRDLSPQFSLELNHAISGQGPTFHVQLPIPHHKGQTTLIFTCADDAGYTVQLPMLYTVYEQVSITPISDQRTVAGTLTPPFPVTCGGGIAPYTLVKQYNDGAPGLHMKIAGQSPTFFVHLEQQGTTSAETAQFAVQCLDSHKYSASEQFSYTVSAPLTMSHVDSIHTVINAPPRSFNVHCHGGFAPYNLTAREQQSPRGTGFPRISISHADGSKFVVTIASAITVVHSLLVLTCTEATGVQVSHQFTYTSHNSVAVETVETIFAVVGTRPEEIHIDCVGGFAPYTITATTDAIRPVSATEVRHALTPEGWLRLPTPSFTGDAYITVKCSDSIGSKTDWIITYSVKPTVHVSNVDPVVQAIAGKSPASFAVSCHGGFAPYRLVPIKRSSRGDEIPGSEAHEHHHHHHHHGSRYDEDFDDLNGDFDHPHRSRAQLWVSGLSPDFTLTLPPVEERQTWEIELQCYDSIDSRGTTSFRYHIHDVVHVADVSPAEIKTVVDVRPEPIIVTCEGGFPPYQVFVTSSVAAIVPDVHPFGRGHDHKFKILLPNPTSKDTAELLVSCVDQFSNTDQTIVQYQIYNQVVVDYINDVRTVAGRQADPIEITCHGGTGKELEIRVFPDTRAIGDEHGLKIRRGWPSYHQGLAESLKGIEAQSIGGFDRNHVQRWSLQLPRPKYDIVAPGSSAASVIVMVHCWEKHAKKEAPLDIALQAVQFTYYVEAPVSGTVKPDQLATEKPRHYRLTTRVDETPREFRITCAGGLGTAGYTLEGSVEGDFSRRILPSHSLHSYIAEIKERTGETTGRFTRGAERGEAHRVVGGGGGDRDRGIGNHRPVVIGGNAREERARVRHNLHDIDSEINEFQERVGEQRRATEARFSASTTFAISLPPPIEYGTVKLLFTCRDIESDSTNEPAIMQYHVLGPVQVDDIDDEYTVSGRQPPKVKVLCSSPDRDFGKNNALKWSISCQSSNHKLLSTTKLNGICVSLKPTLSSGTSSATFHIELPRPSVNDVDHSALTVTCIEERLGQASTTFEYHVHAPLELRSDKTRMVVVENDNAEIISLTCEGGYHPLTLWTTISEPSIFPYLGNKIKKDVPTEYFNNLARVTSHHDRVQRWEIDLKQVSPQREHKSSSVKFRCASPHVKLEDKHDHEHTSVHDHATVHVEVQPAVEVTLDEKKYSRNRVDAVFGDKYHYRFTVWCSGGSSRDYQVRGWIEGGSNIGVEDQDVKGTIDRDHIGHGHTDRTAYSVKMPRARDTGEAHVILICKDIKSGSESQEYDVIYSIHHPRSSHHAHHNEQRFGIDASPESIPLPNAALGGAHDSIRSATAAPSTAPAATGATSTKPAAAPAAAAAAASSSLPADGAAR